MDDFFLAEGGAPALEEIDGGTAVTLNANGAQTDAYQSFEDAPAGLVGIDPTRSIEAWVWNPDLVGEETILSWGRRGGPDGTNMSFNYGTHPAFGAVGHWGDAPDLGWGDITPAAGRWHHLVYTYDGTTTRVYADGLLSNIEVLGAGVINTHDLHKIVIGKQIDNEVGDLNAPLAGSMSYGRIRVHDEVLSTLDVQRNYLAEVSDFPPPAPPEPEAIPFGPIHRYSFDGDAVDSVGGADGTVIGDVTFLDGQATLNNDGSQLSNANGQSPPADPPGAYIDLPNGLISSLGNVATFEIWTTWESSLDSNWQRIFDFGISAGGEDISDGAVSQHYLYLTPRSGADTTRVGYRDGLPVLQGGSERILEALRVPQSVEQHIVLVWDGENTSATLYVNGFQVSRDGATHFSLSDIPDVNNWLGRSQWNDPLYGGSYNEFRIYDYPLTSNQVFGNFEAGPDTVNTGGGGDRFVRMDPDSSGNITLTDGVVILNGLFRGQPIACQLAGDTDDSNTLGLTDGVRVFLWLFSGGDPSPPPFGTTASYDAADCGPDPTPGGDLTCETPAMKCQ
jgi:hypothetical protein